MLNLTPPSKIGSGICFLDHMIDQLQSHGQLGVALRCRVGDGPWARPILEVEKGSAESHRRRTRWRQKVP